MVDHASIETRLQRLSELTAVLATIRGEGRSSYEDESRTALAAQYAIQQAVQICIDIGAHVISELGLTVPDDYRGVFQELRKAGLDDALADRLSSAAGMRNILVHGYLDVDDDIVWGALENLEDFSAFATAIEQIAAES